MHGSYPVFAWMVRIGVEPVQSQYWGFLREANNRSWLLGHSLTAGDVMHRAARIIEKHDEKFGARQALRIMLGEGRRILIGASRRRLV